MAITKPTEPQAASASASRPLLRSRLDLHSIAGGVAALALGFGALALYARTGAPTALSGDQAEHQFTAYVLGVPHATGYPLFTLLNALAMRMLPFGDVARRVTLATALYSALAVVLAFFVARRITASTLAGLLAGATLALAPEFWGLATIAEVYTFQVLLLFAVLLALLRWWPIAESEPELGLERRGLRHPLALASLLAGLGATHHGSFVPIVGPALLATVAAPLLWRLRSASRRGPALRLIGRCLLWALVGFTPWLYLAIQFALFRPFDYYRGAGLPYHPYWGNPQSWGDVLNLALGAGFRLKVFTHGWEYLPALLAAHRLELRYQFWWPGLMLGAVGALALLRRVPWAGGFTALVWLCATLFGLNVAADVPKAHVYFLPAYAIIALWAGVGGWRVSLAAARVLPLSSSVRQPVASLLPGAIVLGLLVLPLRIGSHRFERMDLSERWELRQTAEHVLAAVDPGAVILCRWEECMTLRYLQLVENRRLDVQLDQTEPEAGANWAERAALYLPEHPVYALSYNPDLERRYRIFPIESAGELFRVDDPRSP